MERAVLAYSGGLDTSVTIRWLSEHGYEVHAVAVNVGQQEDVDQIRRRGELAGAKSVRVVNAVDRFASEFLAPAIKANGLYEGKYPMVSSLARPLIADEVIRVARELGAGVVAHGCTGKGNDQVRFEVSFGVLAPDLRILAPIRDPGIPREKAVNPALMNNSGMAMPRPSTVAIIAWPMPCAISFGSLEPEATIAWKVMIMPMTVPIRPSSGPAATARRRNDWKRSSFGISRSTASESRNSASSTFSGSCSPPGPSGP